ncbi:MAG: hypothetical protein IPJ16_08295 [Bacteroidales bacterium]|nr:hypothetical protein [Bacteroidales bacterium]
MKDLIRKYPSSSFIVIALFCSWTLWLLMILSSRGLLPFRFPTSFIGSFGPAVRGSDRYRSIRWRAGIKEFSDRWFVSRASPAKSYCRLFFLLLLFMC